MVLYKHCKNCGTQNESDVKICEKCGEPFDSNRSARKVITEKVNQIIKEGTKGKDYGGLESLSFFLKIISVILVIAVYIAVYYLGKIILPAPNQLLLSLLIGTLLATIPFLITYSAANKIDLMIALEKNSRKTSAYLEAVVYLLCKEFSVE